LNFLRFPRRRLLLLAGPILLPGLILGYLSFRSVKDERLLLEKSQESRYESFADAVEQTLRKTRQAHMDRLRTDLSEGGSGETALEAWALAARLLENPLVRSAVVFRNEEAVFPRLARDPARTSMDSLAAAPGVPHPLERVVRAEWRAGRVASALRAVRQLLHGSDSLAAGEVETRFGYRLLELKCLVQQNESREAVGAARSLVRDLLASPDLESHHRTGFFLSEITGIMTAREDLPRDARDEFFALHQRLPSFLDNAEAVARDWPGSPEEILRGQPFTPEDSLKVQYYAGSPYLLIRFPWLESDTQVLLRLDEDVFVGALRAELLQDRRSAWREADFTVFNLRDETVLASQSPREQEPALERSLEDQFPAWRLVVYKRPAGELIVQGRWRIALQYTLLGFSLLSLLVGVLVLFRGLDEAQRLVSMKANFLSAVSHELKTPLTAIRMFSEMIASGRAPGEKGVQYAGRIGAEAERLQGMIEAILAYTRLEEDPGALRFEEVDLSGVARESAGLLAEAFTRAGIGLVQRLAPRATLRADYNAMRSIVQNLLENALKYSRAGTTVTLEVTAGNEDIVLRVADQGIGIAPDDLKRIFDRFYRAGDEMTRKTRGSGLGLALVKRIADAHGAAIKVNSRTGEGTEMIVTFPRDGKKGREKG
jgi:signal transduction histidine kinase